MKSPMTISLACLAIFISFPQWSSAQWVPTNGPGGGCITALAVSGTDIFAGTMRGGIFRSANNGESWARADSGLPPHVIYSLAVSGTNLFAGLQQYGVFLSADNGSSWRAVNSGLVTSVHGPTAYCLLASGTDLFAGTDSGLYLTEDNGASWTPVNSGMRSGTSVDRLAVSGTNLVARNIGYGARVYLSKDYGATGLRSPRDFPQIRMSSALP